MNWKSDWPRARQRMVDWWNHKGMALCLKSPRNEALAPIPKPTTPSDLMQQWIDPVYRCSKAEWEMANTCFFAEAFPYFDTYVGPGSMGTFIGATPHFAPETVWYEPCIAEPESYGPITFDPSPGNHWFHVHMALIEEGLRRSKGRYLVGIPDLVENLDTLAALRDTEKLLMDLAERPEWVCAKVEEINEAYFQAFDVMFSKVKDADGGNAYCAFNIWSPGKTAKLQCDISCMFSKGMFGEFVMPSLRRQCKWLDYTVYHLDGEDAMQHLDALLSIDELDAIEWTPVGASGRVLGMPGCGSPVFYDLYRRIKKAGKSVQAVQVRPEEVVPLIEAVGPEGMFIEVCAPDQATAERLYEVTEKLR